MNPNTKLITGYDSISCRAFGIAFRFFVQSDRLLDDRFSESGSETAGPTDAGAGPMASANPVAADNHDGLI